MLDRNIKYLRSYST